MMRRLHTLIFAYVSREFLLSFIVAFLFFFFIFFINQLLLLAEDILQKDVALFDVAKLILYSLPSIVALAFPFGALVGALMAVGRLSSSNEVIAFQASGVPLGKLFLPMALLGVLFSVFSFFMNDYLLPVGTMKFGRLYRELLYANPNLELEPYSVKEYQDSIIVTGPVKDGKLRDIVIFEEDENNNTRVITSQSADLEEKSGQGVLTLNLDDVFSQTADLERNDRGGLRYDYFSSGQMRYNILLRDITVSVRSPGPREMSSVDVYDTILEKRAELAEREAKHRIETEYQGYALHLQYQQIANGRDSPQEFERLQERLTELRELRDKDFHDRSLRLYELEFYKKFSIPFGSLSFVVFAFPVGLAARRSGRAVGFGIGLLVAFLYWSMLIAGQTLGVQRTVLSPFWAMWLPNVLVLVVGVVSLILRARR